MNYEIQLRCPKLRERKMRVKRYFPFEDKQGRFVAYCDFRIHRGMPLTPQVCERRHCEYYHKFYLDKTKKTERFIHKVF
jgi:hypothetical protein